MKHWEQTYALPAGGRVVIDQHHGRVRIVGWDQEILQVSATYAGDGQIEERLAVRVNGNQLEVDVTPIRPGFLGLWGQDSPVDLELFVPRGTPCQVDTGSGPVEIEQTMGSAVVDTGSGSVRATGLAEARIDTGSGSVQVRQIDGPLTVDTGSGKIEVETVLGPVELDSGSGSVNARRIGRGLVVETGSGSITVADVEGPIELEAGSGAITVTRIASKAMSVETGSGAVRLQGIDVLSLEAETGSGRLEVEFSRLPVEGHYKLETGSGGVTVVLPPDQGLRFALSGGRLDYGTLPVQILQQDEDEVKGQIGTGGAMLAVETNRGSIRLRAGQPAGAEGPRAAAARMAELAEESVEPVAGDQLAQVLQMVQEGRLTTEEAEEILRALEEEA